MKNQNAAEPNAKVPSVLNSDKARTAPLPSETGRVRTDKQLTSIVAGILFPVFAQGVERKH